LVNSSSSSRSTSSRTATDERYFAMMRDRFRLRKQSRGTRVTNSIEEVTYRLHHVWRRSGRSDVWLHALPVFDAWTRRLLPHVSISTCCFCGNIAPGLHGRRKQARSTRLFQSDYQA
jgi:hypothetical protein